MISKYRKAVGLRDATHRVVLGRSSVLGSGHDMAVDELHWPFIWAFAFRFCWMSFCQSVLPLPPVKPRPAATFTPVSLGTEYVGVMSPLMLPTVGSCASRSANLLPLL